MIINSIMIGLNLKNWQEVIINVIKLAPLLIMLLLLFELDYCGPNLIIKKNSKIKLLIDFLLLILLICTLKVINSSFYRVWYYWLIAAGTTIFADALLKSLNINNPIIVCLHKIIYMISLIIFFPFEIRNKLLKKIYNIDIKEEELHYLNMSLISIFFSQSIISVSIFCFDIEGYLNKYFFGFAIGTFISYFAIDIVIMLIGSNDKSTKKYRFMIKKTFLIVLMIELIIIAFMANIDYGIVSKLEIVRVFRLGKSALKELFDSITLCTLVLQLLEYRNTQY